MSKTENYTVTFVGATPNQAQAIEGVIQSVLQLKGKDELPMKKYESELEPMYKDLLLFKQLHILVSNMVDNNLKEQIEKRIEYYNAEIAKRETAIKGHKENIEYINSYVRKIRSHIHENVNANEKTVTYTYDMDYITPFLDLAMIAFEMSFEEPKNNQTAKVS